MGKFLNNNIMMRRSTFENPTTIPDKRLKHVTNQMEAQYFEQTLKLAFKNIDIMGNGPGSHIYKGMYLEELSKSAEGNLGMSKMMFEYLKQQEGGKF